MVGSLSDFFRSSLNKGKEVVTVREELQHVRSYLEIQQIRYQDILKYEIDVPESLYGYEIPKITVQPVVENALYHGIKEKRGGGTIRVEGSEDENDLFIRVIDNGMGMDEERMAEVIRGLSDKNPEAKKIYGLYNVNERIRLGYGEEYGISMESAYGEGTTVTIHLPKKLTEIVRN
jgi:two-component system sensor histidine kinase YesM